MPRAKKTEPAPPVATPSVPVEAPPVVTGPRPQREYSNTRISLATRVLLEDIQKRLVAGVALPPAAADVIAAHRAPDGGYPFCNLVDLGLRLVDQMLTPPAVPPPEVAPRKRVPKDAS